MKKLISLLLLCLSLISCSDLPVKYYEVEINREFSLGIGEYVIISKEGMIISFTDVTEDSRCPIDQICVWAGNANVKLEIKNSAGELSIVYLSTYLDPRRIEFGDFFIELRDLKPYPRSTQIINKGDYFVTLKVESK